MPISSRPFPLPRISRASDGRKAMRELDQHSITEEVLRRFERCENPRLKHILDGLVRHLHDFVREEAITEAEWVDGPVGEMLEATGRHPWRPAHVHFMISAPGFRRLVTHIFVDGDRYLDSDAVFGVKESLIDAFPRSRPGSRPTASLNPSPIGCCAIASA